MRSSWMTSLCATFRRGDSDPPAICLSTETKHSEFRRIVFHRRSDVSKILSLELVFFDKCHKHIALQVSAAKSHQPLQLSHLDTAGTLETFLQGCHCRPYRLHGFIKANNEFTPSLRRHQRIRLTTLVVFGAPVSFNQSLIESEGAEK
jgi:hypothetical protein